MKMVAAARLKKAQDTVTNFRPYIYKMQEIMEHVVSSVGDDPDNIYAEDREYKQALIIVITSNRGLCGAFNSNVVKEAVQLAERKYGRFLAPGKVRYMCIGKKGHDALRRRIVSLDAPPNTELVEHLTYDKAAEVAQALMDEFTSKRYDCIDIVYNEFVNAATQKVICKQFLPLLPEGLQHKEKNVKNVDKSHHPDYIFEPTRKYILNELIPQDLRLSFYGTLLDSIASEFGARMTSMHQATDNASTLIQELTLQYNKARQAAITNEILEIVGGAEALKG